MIQATLAIIKPDATKRNIIGQILQRAEDQDLNVAAMKLIHLTKKQAEGFYFVHREKPFFNDLTDFMSEGLLSSWFSGVKRLFDGGETSWGRPIRFRRNRGPSGLCLARASSGTQPMEATAANRLTLKSVTFSRVSIL